MCRRLPVGWGTRSGGCSPLTCPAWKHSSPPHLAACQQHQGERTGPGQCGPGCAPLPETALSVGPRGEDYRCGFGCGKESAGKVGGCGVVKINQSNRWAPSSYCQLGEGGKRWFPFLERAPLFFVAVHARVSINREKAGSNVDPLSGGCLPGCPCRTLFVPQAVWWAVPERESSEGGVLPRHCSRWTCRGGRVLPRASWDDAWSVFVYPLSLAAAFPPTPFSIPPTRLPPSEVGMVRWVFLRWNPRAAQLWDCVLVAFLRSGLRRTVWRFAMQSATIIVFGSCLGLLIFPYFGGCMWLL